MSVEAEAATTIVNNVTPLPRSRPWLVLGIAYVCVVAFAVVFGSVPPVLDLIRRELHLSHTQSGLLMGYFALPGIFLTVPGGFLADRYGPRPVGTVCLVLMVAGTAVVATSRDFTWLSIGRVLSGTGAIILSIIAAKLVSNAFANRRLGLAMGIHNTAMPIGVIFSFLALPLLASRYGWRLGAYGSLVMSLIALAVFSYGLHIAPQSMRRQTHRLRDALFGAGPEIWLLGLVWLWFNAAVIAYLTFGKDFFMTELYGELPASLLVVSIMIAALFVSPIVGLMADRLKMKEYFIALGTLVMAAVFVVTPVAGPSLPTAVLVLGIASAMVPAPLFALPAELLPAEDVGLGFGVISTCLNVGILIGPWLVGYARDASGSYLIGFVLMAVFSVLALSHALWLVVHRRLRTWQLTPDEALD